MGRNNTYINLFTCLQQLVFKPNAEYHKTVLTIKYTFIKAFTLKQCILDKKCYELSDRQKCEIACDRLVLKLK